MNAKNVIEWLVASVGGDVGGVLWRPLVLLAVAGGAESLIDVKKALADHAGRELPPSTLTHVVNALLGDGLIERTEQENNRRRGAVHLTEKGREQYQRMIGQP
ncbi:MAG: hypothetical protein AB7I98_03800 [Verrucomicrobiales bacterium]